MKVPAPEVKGHASDSCTELSERREVSVDLMQTKVALSAPDRYRWDLHVWVPSAAQKVASKKMGLKWGLKLREQDLALVSVRSWRWLSLRETV